MNESNVPPHIENNDDHDQQQAQGNPWFATKGKADDERSQQSLATLCNRCNAIDFRLVTKDNLAMSFSNLGHITLSRQCPFCNLIMTCLRQQLTTQDNNPTDSASVSIVRRAVLDESPIAAGDIPVTMRGRTMQSHILQHGADTAPSHFIEVVIRPLGEPSISLLLVRVVNEVGAQPEHNALVMVRTPLSGDPFDSGRLQRWLSLSKHHSLPVVSTLSSLIASRRFRVLDMDLGAIVVLTGEVQYTALSYVWGQGAADDSASHGRPIISGLSLEMYVDLESLPETIRDAGTVSKGINIRYMWVDALCIDQSDPEDLEANISSTDAIYENAYITIVAANGDDANAGLSRLRANSENYEVPTAFMWRQRPMSFLPLRDTIDRTLQETTWGSRGWTFQEMLLSQTYVAFTKEEVMFHCPKFDRREAYKVLDYSQGLAQIEQNSSRAIRVRTLNFTDPRADSPNTRFVRFDSAVEEYSRRKLTYPGDRLDAFAGILKNHDETDVRAPDKAALSGLLEGTFYECLFWQFDSEASRLKSPKRIREDKRRSRFLPSWSWARKGAHGRMSS